MRICHITNYFREYHGNCEVVAYACNRIIKLMNEKKKETFIMFLKLVKRPY